MQKRYIKFYFNIKYLLNVTNISILSMVEKGSLYA